MTPRNFDATGPGLCGSLSLFCFSHVGDGSKGCIRAKQALYHLVLCQPWPQFGELYTGLCMSRD